MIEIKHFLNNIKRKILASILLLIMVLGMYPLNNVFAAGEVNIIAGSNLRNHQINMVVEVTLVADFTCGSWMDIFFLEPIMPTVFTANDVNVMHIDGGGPGIDTSAYMTFFAGSAGNSSVGFDHNASGCVTIPAGDTIAFYLGPEDNSAEGYVTGVADQTDGAQVLYFNDSAVNLITNPVDITEIGFYTNSNVAANSGLTGSYSLEPLEEDILAYGTVDPYITLSVVDSTLDFADIQPGVLEATTASVLVETNARNGYTLRYRAGELGLSTDSFLRADGGALEPKEWGINIVSNTTLGAGALPVNNDGNPYDNDNIGLLVEGVDYGIMNNYDGDEDYYLAGVDTLDTLLINNGPSSNTVTITAAISPVHGLLGGKYSTRVTMNVYANF